MRLKWLLSDVGIMGGFCDLRQIKDKAEQHGGNMRRTHGGKKTAISCGEKSRTQLMFLGVWWRVLVLVLA